MIISKAKEKRDITLCRCDRLFTKPIFGKKTRDKITRIEAFCSKHCRKRYGYKPI